MIPRLHASLTFVLTLLLAAASPSFAFAHHTEETAKTAKGEKILAENRALDRRFFDAFNARDTATMTSLYWNNPELVSVDPQGNATKGFDAVRKFWTDYFAMLESVRVEQLESNYLVVGEAVLGTGRIRFTQKIKGQPEQTWMLRYTDVRRKINGQWLFVYDQAMMLPGETATSANLYKRLGGYDAIAAVVDEFIKRMAGDPRMAKFLMGLSANSQAHLRQLIVDQVCAATGGPCLYTGRDMKTSHKGLGISGADWDIAAGHLVGALDALGVGEREKNDLVGIVVTLKADIVEK